MGEQIARGAGAAAGYATHGFTGAAGVAAAFWGLRKLTTSTAWNTVSAATKARLADALAKGDFSAANAIAAAAMSEGTQRQTPQFESAPALGSVLLRRTAGIQR